MKADSRKTKNDKSRPLKRQERETRNLVEKTAHLRKT
jgi:hypothetical protein